MSEAACGLRTGRGACGFTLIELVVVLLIIGTALSLVGPNLFRTYEKVQAQSEVRVLTEVLNNVGFSAYLSRTPAQVQLSGQRVTVMPENKVYTFRWIVFPEESQIRFSATGFPNLTQVKVGVGDSIYNLSFPVHQNTEEPDRG